MRENLKMGSVWGYNSLSTAKNHRSELKQTFCFLHDKGRLTSGLLHSNISTFDTDATLQGYGSCAGVGENLGSLYVDNQSHPDTRNCFSARPEGRRRKEKRKVSCSIKDKQPEETARKQPESGVSQLNASNTSLQFRCPHFRGSLDGVSHHWQPCGFQQHIILNLQHFNNILFSVFLFTGHQSGLLLINEASERQRVASNQGCEAIPRFSQQNGRG